MTRKPKNRVSSTIKIIAIICFLLFVSVASLFYFYSNLFKWMGNWTSVHSDEAVKKMDEKDFAFLNKLQKINSTMNLDDVVKIMGKPFMNQTLTDEIILWYPVDIETANQQLNTASIFYNVTDGHLGPIIWTKFGYFIYDINLENVSNSS